MTRRLSEILQDRLAEEYEQHKRLRAAAYQALEALEEKHVGALRDKAMQDLRDALMGKPL